MYKQAVIHYPEDERLLVQISKDIAALHCSAAIKYMDLLQLDESQKIMVIDSLLLCHTNAHSK